MGARNMEYDVELPSLRKRFKASHDETILAAALRNKISLNFKCGNGSCKTCVARLLSGTIAYPWKPPRALTESDMAQGEILVCQAAATSDLQIDAKVRTGLMEEMRLHELKLALDGISIRAGMATVAGLRRVSHDVTMLRLKPDHAPAWLPGQYLTIGANGIERDFSIASLPAEGAFELHIRHVPGGRFTSWIGDGIRPGDTVSWEGPLGTFFHRARSNRPMLLIAGGTGFSPIKGVILSAMAQQKRVPMRLYWGVRAERDLYAADLAHQWAAGGDLAFIPVLSEPGPDDGWTGETGFVHSAVERHERALAGHDIYIAGPPPMVESASKVVLAKGARADRIFTDSFDFSASTQNRIAAEADAVAAN